MKKELLITAPTKKRLLEMCIEYWAGSSIVLNDDGTVNNAKGLIKNVCWEQHRGRYKLFNIL